MKNITLFVALSSFFIGTAQDDLIKSVAGNQSANAGFQFTTVINLETTRSEERRVGKECRSRWSPYH